MIKLFEMFSGYGGASFGLKKANIPFECVGFSEVDKNAIKIYLQNHYNARNYGDCTKINPDELPDFDLLTGGFPCQDVSIAGQRDLSKGRTNLYNEILRIAKVKKPKYMILENVKGLLSMEVDEIRLVDKIIRDLKNLGYGVAYKVLNSKHYGIPQNRERIWFVCKLNGWEFMEFQFPKKEESKIFIKDILEKTVPNKYYLKEKMLNTLIKRTNENHSFKSNWINNNSKEVKTITTRSDSRYTDNFILQKHHSNEVKEYQDIMPTLSKEMGGNQPYIFEVQQKTRDVEKAINVAQELANKEDKPIQIDLYHLQYGEMRPLSSYIPQDFDVYRCLQAGEPKEILIEPNNVMNCLTEAQGRQGSSKEFIKTCKIIGRRLTPRECFRLMGFLNDEINIQGIADTNLYKLAGNGWDINLVSKIFKNILFNNQPFKEKQEVLI